MSAGRTVENTQPGRNHSTGLCLLWDRVLGLTSPRLVLITLCLQLGCGPVEEQGGPGAESDRPATVSNSARLDSPPKPTSTSQAAAEAPASRPIGNAASAGPKVPILFHEVAQESGVQFQFFTDAVPDRFFLPEVMGGGVAWFDMDRDGLLDLFCVNGAELRPDTAPTGGHPNQLFQNRGGGRFVAIPVGGAPVAAGYGQGCAAGDFDADGFEDLYLTYYGQDHLFRNLGDGTFEDVTSEAGIRDDWWGSSVVWGDWNNDQLLDVYVVNYLDVTFRNHRICQYENHGPGYCGPGDFEAVPDLVYLNQGDGRFVEARNALGFDAPDGKGLAIVVADLNRDARAEIYVANDMAPNFLFVRDADSTTIRYRETAFEHACAVSESGLHEASMGIACADYDRNGLPDIFLTHYFGQKNTLYRNLGHLQFIDDSRRTRVAAASYARLGFGTCSLDVDRDGANDLLIANGHVLGKNHHPNEMEPTFLWNDGTGRFQDVSATCGEYFRGRWLGRGLAAGDYDEDGDTDVAITHLDRPHAILRNDTPSAAPYVGLALESANRIPPAGAQVRLLDGDQSHWHAYLLGGSYLSHHDSRLLIATKSATVSVEVYWPSGTSERFDGLATRRYWRLREGRGVPCPPLPQEPAP